MLSLSLRLDSKTGEMCLITNMRDEHNAAYRDSCTKLMYERVRGVCREVRRRYRRDRDDARAAENIAINEEHDIRANWCLLLDPMRGARVVVGEKGVVGVSLLVDAGGGTDGGGGVG